MRRNPPEDGRALIRTYLSEQEERAWLGLLETREAIVRFVDAELVRSHGLPLSSFDVLVAIAHAPGGEVAISVLADQVMLSPSRISRLVIEFEREGLVERRRSATDARSTRARITQAGQERLRDAAPTYLGTVKRLLVDRLSPRDIEHLARTWNRLAAQDRSGVHPPA